MDRLLSCSTITISLIRKLLIHVVRDAFYVRFGFIFFLLVAAWVGSRRSALQSAEQW